MLQPLLFDPSAVHQRSIAAIQITYLEPSGLRRKSSNAFAKLMGLKLLFRSTLLDQWLSPLQKEESSNLSKARKAPGVWDAHITSCPFLSQFGPKFISETKPFHYPNR